MDNEILLGNVMSSLVATDDLIDIDWVEIAVIFEYDAENNLSSTYGFAYKKNHESVAISFIPFQISESVDAYRSFVCRMSDTRFSRMLFQFNRVSGRAKADFAFGNDNRWTQTDSTGRLQDLLRPNLS